MIWTSVVIGAVIGAVAAVLAFLGAGPAAGRGKRLGMLFAVIFLPLYGAAQAFVVPHAQARYTLWQVDRELAQNPAFAALKQYDGPTYRNVLTELGLLAREGKGKDEVARAVRGILEPLVIKRIAQASDEAAARYMKVMMEEMKQLYSQGGDLCYRFLFPGKDTPGDLQKYISAETRKEDMAALGDVLRSAAVGAQPPPLKSEVEPLLEPAVAAIAERYGRDLIMFQAPRAPGVDKSKVCEITINLYGRILRLPPDQSGKTIRYMLQSK